MNRDLTGKHMDLLDLGVPNSTNSWQFIYMSNMIPISDKLIPFHPEMMIRIDSQWNGLHQPAVRKLVVVLDKMF